MSFMRSAFLTLLKPVRAEEGPARGSRAEEAKIVRLSGHVRWPGDRMQALIHTYDRGFDVQGRQYWTLQFSHWYMNG